MPDSAAADTEQNNDDNADFTLRIPPVEIKITARRKIKTTDYNGGVPGPVLRVRKGRTVTIDVYNDSKPPSLFISMD
jgi:FtsP/CotA-like multicopper oxidase with cupredoxin domain